MRSLAPLLLTITVLTACADPTLPPPSTSKPTLGSLSELRIPDLRLVDDRVVSAGQPTAADLAQAKALGVELVANFRALDEDPGFDEKATTEGLGMRYVHIPMKGKESLTKENLAAFADLMRESRGRALLHCRTGNRVGALYALDAALRQGMEIEAAIELGKRAGLTKLESAVREVLAEAKAR